MASRTTLGWRTGLLDGGVGRGHRREGHARRRSRTAPTATDTARVAPAITEMTAAIAPSVETIGATSDTWPMRRA